MQKLSNKIILLILVITAQPLQSQVKLKKPPRRTENLLELNAARLKTIHTFETAYYDTLPQPGPDPLLVARYEEMELIPRIFDAVFKEKVSVYNPNYWGSVPQFIEKAKFELIDSTKILEYLEAGWDTSFMIGNNGEVSKIIDYRGIPYEEISGIFFFESWWLDQKTYRLFKDVHAYLPIREYLASIYEGYDNNELRKRLLFMVIPEWAEGTFKPSRFRSRDFIPLRKDINYSFKLYNKSYDLYLNREEEDGEISRTEYHEWQYHQFDFHRFFDADRFLERIITGILNGKLKVFYPGDKKTPMERDVFMRILNNIPESSEPGESGYAGEMSKRLPQPEEYPLYDLNSLEFHEDWYFNPVNLAIYKHVKGVTINRHSSQYDPYTGDFIRSSVEPVFSVWFE